MNKISKISALICFVILTPVIVFSAIINVPSDQPTIQTGIDASTNGDTILVEPAVYIENINLNGHNVVLASHFLITGDLMYIDSTIIDGNASGSVVTFENGEDSSALITGFTIMNGAGHRGGGIYCDSANPIIQNNIIMYNLLDYNSAIFGGGVYCSYCQPTIKDNIIIGNQARSGGGISLYFADPLIIGNIISNNGAQYRGGGISCSRSNPYIVNNTISNNFCEYPSEYSGKGGGIGCFDSHPIVSNSILWNNFAATEKQINLDSTSTIDITYSNIEGGWTGLGNIDADPFFFDSSYNVCSQSLCIDAGDPLILDPDSTRSDMGVFFSDHPDCTIGKIIYVSNSGNDEYGEGTESNPFKTIQHAVNQSLSGDTIIVDEGVYFENIFIEAKKLLLASDFIFSEDSTDINNTIIDGSVSGSVIEAKMCNHKIVIDGFTITNGSRRGYAGIYSRFCNIYIQNNKIIDNIAENTGGGIGCISSEQVIRNNMFQNNRAINYHAGAVYCYHASGEIYSNIFIENNCENIGGAVYCLVSEPLIEHNLFCGNQSGKGGAIGLHISDAIIRNNTIVNNIANSIGGGLYVTPYSDPFVTKSIIWGNMADDYNQIYTVDTSSAIFSFCDIDGGWEGVGNFDADPLLCDTANDDYHIVFNSPCAPDNNLYGNLIGALDVGCGENRVTISPSVMYAADAHTYGTFLANAEIFNVEDGYSIYDIDTSTLMINDSISTIDFKYLTIDSIGEVLKMSFPISEFVMAYMPIWDTSMQMYTISGQFNDFTEFSTMGWIKLIGHRSGDANGDGLVNIFDITYLIAYLYLNGPRPLILESVDVNGDGEVDIFDVTYLVSYLYLDGPEPVCP